MIPEHIREHIRNEFRSDRISFNRAWTMLVEIGFTGFAAEEYLYS